MKSSLLLMCSSFQTTDLRYVMTLCDGIRTSARMTQLLAALLLLCAATSTCAFVISCEHLCGESSVVGSHFCDCDDVAVGGFEEGVEADKRSGNTARSYNRIFKWGKREPESDSSLQPANVNRRIFRWGKRSDSQGTSQDATDRVRDSLRQLQFLNTALAMRNVGGDEGASYTDEKRDQYNKIFKWG